MNQNEHTPDRPAQKDKAAAMSSEESRAAFDGELALEKMRETLERAAQKLAAYEAKYREADDLSAKATVLCKALGFVATSPLQSVLVELATTAQRRMHGLLPDELDYKL